MLLTRFDPFKEFSAMQKAFGTAERTNDDMSISAFVPKVNTREDSKAYYIDIDLPGIKKEEIDIDVHDGMLTIKGERNFKEEVKEEDYYKVETSFGKFQRAFSLPDNIDTDNITASSVDGVLEVVVPKLEKDINRKKIEIK
jgi:HSP20 family protein